jgi:hypothetical protein
VETDPNLRVFESPSRGKVAFGDLIMTKLRKVLVQTAVASAIGLSGLTIGAGVASAQSWFSHTERRCDGDRCATYRCEWNGCRRISGWDYNGYNYNGYNYNGYYYRNTYGGYRTMERCYNDRCATFRCDADGDRCTRVSGWRYRY